MSKSLQGKLLDNWRRRACNIANEMNEILGREGRPRILATRGIPHLESDIQEGLRFLDGRGHMTKVENWRRRLATGSDPEPVQSAVTRNRQNNSTAKTKAGPSKASDSDASYRPGNDSSDDSMGEESDEDSDIEEIKRGFPPTSGRRLTQASSSSTRSDPNHTRHAIPRSTPDRSSLPPASFPLSQPGPSRTSRTDHASCRHAPYPSRNQSSQPRSTPFHNFNLPPGSYTVNIHRSTDSGDHESENRVITTQAGPSRAVASSQNRASNDQLQQPSSSRVVGRSYSLVHRPNGTEEWSYSEVYGN